MLNACKPQTEGITVTTYTTRHMQLLRCRVAKQTQYSKICYTHLMQHSLVDQVRQKLGCRNGDGLVVALVRALELRNNPAAQKEEEDYTGVFLVAALQWTPGRSESCKQHS
jgi:hypothetical protein